MRKRFDEQFNVKVALEAVKEEQTLQELKEKDELFRQLGEMQYQNEWLRKKDKQLYGKDPG